MTHLWVAPDFKGCVCLVTGAARIAVIRPAIRST